MDTLSMHPTLLFMLKMPQPGYVKTRLATAIGMQAACDAYRRIVEHILQELAPYRSIEIHYAPGNRAARTTLQNWLGATHSYFPQPEGDLGQRMHSAVKGAFSRNAQSVAVLGGDCPYIKKATITKAIQALAAFDVVIGPAPDGGYYLLALKKPQPELFRGIAWGTKTVFTTTLKRAREAKLTVHLLACAEDVDDLSSWNRAQAYLGPKGPTGKANDTVH